MNVDLDAAEAMAGSDKMVKSRFDCVTVDQGCQMIQLTGKERAELYRKVLMPHGGGDLNQRELIFLEYQFDSKQADQIYKQCQSNLLEKIKQRQATSPKDKKDPD